MNLATRSALLSVTGMRPSNEDAVLEVDLPDGRHLVAVADGMGGHRSGEVASRVALQILADALRAGSTLDDAVRAANSGVLDEANRNPECSGMGTTLLAILRSGSAYQIANVGDSRAYRVDRSGISQLTVDHSFAAEAARAGELSADEIARSPWRNALTRSLGTHPEIEADLFGPFEIVGTPHVVLLCTDGLHKVLSDQAIWRDLLRSTSPSGAAKSLVGLAVQNGSDDNISLALVEFGAMLDVVPDAAEPGAAADPPRLADTIRWEVGLSNPSSLTSFPISAASSVGRLFGPVTKRRTTRRRPTLLGRVLSNDVLFLICVGALLLWLLLNTSSL